MIVDRYHHNSSNDFMYTVEKLLIKKIFYVRIE